MVTDKLIIFDYDGVIADSLSLWMRAFEEAGVKNRIPYRLDTKTIDSLEHITFGAILKQAGLEKDERAAGYVADIFDVFYTGSSDVSFFTGIGMLMKDLRGSGNLVCINTANDTGIVKIKLEQEGLLSFITDIAGGDVPGSKSEKISAFLKKYSFLPENTFMIGDSLGDVTEGKKAGVRTIAAGYGWHKMEKLLSGSPDYYCPEVADIYKVFNETVR